MADAARLAQLEELISSMRHDIRGALSSTRLVTDRMLADPDARMQKFGATIDRATQRILDCLDHSRTVVPSKQASP